MRFYPTTTCFVFFSFLVSVSPFVTIVCCWRRWDREILLPKSVMKRENVMMLLAYLYKLCTCLWCKSIHYEIPLAGQVNERIARWPFEIACELLLLHTSARWMFHFDAVRFFNTSPSIEPSDKQSQNDNDVMAVNSSHLFLFERIVIYRNQNWPAAAGARAQLHLGYITLTSFLLTEWVKEKKRFKGRGCP